MKISRRDFLRFCTASSATLAFSTLDLLKLERALAKPNGPTVLWLQGSGCTGCSVSLLKTFSVGMVTAFWTFSADVAAGSKNTRPAGPSRYRVENLTMPESADRWLAIEPRKRRSGAASASGMGKTQTASCSGSYSS